MTKFLPTMGWVSTNFAPMMGAFFVFRCGRRSRHRPHICNNFQSEYPPGGSIVFTPGFLHFTCLVGYASAPPCTYSVVLYGFIAGLWVSFQLAEHVYSPPVLNLHSTVIIFYQFTSKILKYTIPWMSLGLLRLIQDHTEKKGWKKKLLFG